ncbi:MAG: hypothetical protein V1676_06025 [Candidatus Diapherotrites archaeon]
MAGVKRKLGLGKKIGIGVGIVGLGIGAGHAIKQNYRGVKQPTAIVDTRPIPRPTGTVKYMVLSNKGEVNLAKEEMASFREFLSSAKGKVNPDARQVFNMLNSDNISRKTKYGLLKKELYLSNERIAWVEAQRVLNKGELPISIKGSIDEYNLYEGIRKHGPKNGHEKKILANYDKILNTARKDISSMLGK